MLYRPSSFRRSGLTLLELIVVLVILVGLAGIVVPMISNTLSQTRYSTAGANLQEVGTLVSAYQAKYGSYSDGWDTLTVGTQLAFYLPGNAAITGGATTVLGNYLTTVTVTPATTTTTLATTLTNAGIANFYTFSATPANPTFYPYGQYESTPGLTPGSTIANIPLSVNIGLSGSTVTLAALTPQGAQKLNLPNTLSTPTLTTTPTYVVLGLGSRNTMIPKTILDAPVAFADNYVSGPNFVYCRFGVVFQLTDTFGNPLPAAILAGVVAFTNEQGISTLGDQIEKYNNALQLGQ